MIIETQEKIDRLRIKADIFIKTDARAFIVDTNHTWYFCKILSSNDDFLTIDCFDGVYKGEKIKLFWADVIKFKEYEEKVQ